MGCEKFREGGLGVGGVRASMERRWLINAKTTMMRQKKWQEVRMQKEQAEMKKVAEILEKRKRERARLAAYIHMQPAKCTANAPKCSRAENKRSNWNTFLMEDQEIIMKFREKSAVAHTSYYQKANFATDSFWQGSERAQPYGSYTNSYMKGYHAPDQNFAAGTRYIEAPVYESYDHRAKYYTDSDQMSEASAARYSVKSEPLKHTTYAPDAVRYAFMAEDTRRQVAARSKRRSANAHEKEDDQLKVAHSAVQGPPKENSNIATPELAESYTEDYAAAPNSNVLPRDETCSAEPSCDLREEILKARQANEAATARLIAEANAIESRLEDCNVSLKPLDFREAEQDGIAEHMNKYSGDANPLSSDSLVETDSNFSSNSDDVVSGLFSKTSSDSNKDSHCKAKRGVIMEIGAPGSSDTRYPNETDGHILNTVTLGSPKPCHEMNVVSIDTKSKGQENVKECKDDDQSMRNLRKRAAVACASPRTSSEIDWNTKTVVHLAIKVNRKGVSDANSASISGDTSETKISNKKEGSLVWDIDWDTPACTERWPQKNMNCPEGCQQVNRSRMPGRGERKMSIEQNSIKQQLTEDAGVGSLKEERQRFESCCRRPPTVPNSSGDMVRAKVSIPPLPLYHLNLGLSQPMNRVAMQTQSRQSPYTQDENTMGEAAVRSTRRTDTTGDKENYRKPQSGALTEEEEKIFASLERLDWKLAALQSRSVSTGRDSFASQGEFSTKSAPAVMGPPLKKLGFAGLHSSKKTLPYSSVPPRPLTPQSHGPSTGLRRRRQVGLTNKCAGKALHCCFESPESTFKDNGGHSDMRSEKCHSTGMIVCHQSAREIFDTAAACSIDYLKS